MPVFDLAVKNIFLALKNEIFNLKCIFFSNYELKLFRLSFKMKKGGESKDLVSVWPLLQV